MTESIKLPTADGLQLQNNNWTLKKGDKLSPKQLPSQISSSS
jgi:hypothetical protein